MLRISVNSRSEKTSLRTAISLPEVKDGKMRLPLRERQRFLLRTAAQYIILRMWEPKTGTYSSNRTESFWNRALTIKLRSKQNPQRRERSNLPCSARAMHGTAERT